MSRAGGSVDARGVTETPKPDAASLSAEIIGAERRPVHPPAKADFPNPVGGFANILYPVRRYILLAAIVLIPVLVLVSILT
jgi:hypothetical protein